jgi:carboxylesterase type B
MVVSLSKPLRDLEKDGAALFAKLGVKTLKEARQAPWEKIIEAGEALGIPGGPGGLPMPPWDAAVDGWLLPQIPRVIFESGDINAVPFIACANLGELTGPGRLVMPMIIPAYVKMLEAVNKAGLNSYACIFDHIPNHWREKGIVSFHAIELPYVFGDWDNYSEWWGSIVLSMELSGTKMPDIILDADDKYISECMMALWASFAKNGKPGAKEASEWPAYNKTGDKYLYINNKPEVKTGFSKVAQG